jgi:hypothetical protein
VGFQDQVVLGDAEVAADILPTLDAILIALAAVGIPLYRLFFKEEELEAKSRAGAAMGGDDGTEDEKEDILERGEGPGRLTDFLLFKAAARKAKKQPAEKWEAQGAELMRVSAKPSLCSEP